MNGIVTKILSRDNVDCSTIISTRAFIMTMMINVKSCEIVSQRSFFFRGRLFFVTFCPSCGLLNKISGTLAPKKNFSSAKANTKSIQFKLKVANK